MFEPPKKINISFYKCDSKFYLDNILDMFNDEHKIGICLMSGEELKIYIVSISGSHIEEKLIKSLEIKLPNKQKKGGQSAVRFGRIADIVRHQYVIKFAENIVQSYMIKNNTECNVSKIIIAGFGYMPDDVIETQLFQQYLKKYLYKKLSINSIDDTTISKILKEQQIFLEEDKSVEVNNDIKNLVEYNYDLLEFGKEKCLDILTSNNIKKLYINNSAITSEINDILIENKHIDIIKSDSTELVLYGGWLCVKKYENNY
jgi:peptide chain release factor subunit 1